MHSPWGMLYQFVQDTHGWSWHTILWKVSRANLLLMMADRSNFKHVKEEEKVIEQSGADLLQRLKKQRGEV